MDDDLSTGRAATQPIRIVIVDDDALVRSGLSLMLEGSPELDVVGQAANGIEGLRAVAELKPDVVLMDIRMPEMDGLEATEQLLSGPGTPPKVIILTTFDTDDDVLRALGAGASGFLLKDTHPAAIVDAIGRVAAGEPMLSPSVTTTLIHQVTAQPPLSHDRARQAQEKLARLTEREHEVAVAVGRGLTNAEIARDLFLSVPTVKAHISRLFVKLEADNRVQVVLCLHDAGVN